MGFLCQIIKKQVLPNFINLETAIKTYDRNAPVCGSPAWRYVYHTIHSADKWFFNPFVYSEPGFHEDGMDNPDNPCSVELSDRQLLEYLYAVRDKTLRYIDSLTDEMLGEKPENCPYTRFDLVLRQFRHISLHTGMLNGLTVERTGKFPVFVGGEEVFDRLKNGLFDE
ncbi:MAG: DinB family protein [Oscillospiraceae bacterium]